VTKNDQSPTEGEDRRVADDGDVESGASILADEFGTNDIVAGSAEFRGKGLGLRAHLCGSLLGARKFEAGTACDDAGLIRSKRIP